MQLPFDNNLHKVGIKNVAKTRNRISLNEYLKILH